IRLQRGRQSQIWAGKTPPPLPVSGEFHGGGGGGGEMIYDYGSTLRSVRSTSSRSKPRQMLMPASPPPPPIREEDGKDSHHHHQHHLLHLPPDGNTNRKDKKKSNGSSNTMKKKTRSKSRERRQQADTQSLILNGRSTLNGGTARKISSTGSLVGGARGYPPPPAAMMGHHGHPTLPPPPPPPPPMLMTLRPGKKAGTFSSRSKSSRAPFLMVPRDLPHASPRHVLEEPIYMPHNARPLSPIASYQQQQYATIDKASHKAPHRPRARNEEEAELFRNKGHMNERAFSHSIRNEHRSRSYGSLASDLPTKKRPCDK
ncbi:CG12581 CG12581PAlike, partial [Caligus rogercresseyi]